MTKIVICPGHYESYKGVTKNNFNEHDEVLIVAEHVHNKLAALGHESIIIKGTLINKVNEINAINPSLAVEVHLGNSNQSEVRGSRSFYMLGKESSKNLANYILKSCVRALGTNTQGSWVGWYKKITPQMVEDGKAPEGHKAKIDLFLSKVNCPSAIIEPFFLSSEKDCHEFIINNKHEKVADSIVSGIVRFLEDAEANQISEIRELILKQSK